MAESTMIPRFPALPEFQVMFQSVPLDGDDDHLTEVSCEALEALSTDFGPLLFALGPVTSVNLDTRQIEILITVQAADQSELHQKVALISAEFNRRVELPVAASETHLTDTGNTDVLVA